MAVKNVVTKKKGVLKMARNNNYNNNNNRNTTNQPRKRSGCRLIQKEGISYISAWRVTGGQMFSLFARPYKNTRETKPNSRGNSYLTYFATITNKTTGQSWNLSALLDIQTNKLRLPGINQVANPRANNGGYWGKSISKQYNH